jgi:hypothetical protein
MINMIILVHSFIHPRTKKYVKTGPDPADIRRVAGCRCEATLIPFVKEAALPNFLSPRASRPSICVYALRPQRSVTAGVRRAKLIMIADR